MKFNGAEPYIENSLHATVPALIHGNGPAKKVLNSLGNYLAKSWNTEDQVNGQVPRLSLLNMESKGCVKSKTKLSVEQTYQTWL